jgi:hypothetical protein
VELLTMAPFWLRLRADFRQRWRALVGLALLLGLAGGVVLTAASGARRTDTAYPRLLQWANAAQVNVAAPGATGFAADFYAALARLPQVASMSTEILYQVALPGDHAAGTQVYAMSSPDHGLGVAVDRVKVLHGAVFDPRMAGQAMIDPLLANREHVRPGGIVRLLGVPNDPRTGAPDYAKAVPLAFRVSAIVVFDDQIVPTGSAAGEPRALLTSFPVRDAVQTMSYGNEAAVRLRPGASMAAFTAAAVALSKRLPDIAGKPVIFSLSDQTAATERAIRPQAVALAVFAILAGLIALVVIGQLLSRQMLLDSAEYPVLRALGMTRGSLVGLSMARMALVTVAGAVIAVATAVAASPLMPIGPARLAEPRPGVEVDALVGPVGAAIALLPLLLLSTAAWRAASQARGTLGVAEPAAHDRPSRLGALLGRAGTVAGGVGVRMAFEPGRGRTAVPVRSALAGTVVAVAAVAAAIVFGASLIGLVGTPHRYGQNWDADLDLSFGGLPAPIATKFVSSLPAMRSYVAGNYGQLTIDGQIVPAVGLDQRRGAQFLTLLAGRAPADGNEIALGAQTLRAVHRRLGQTVRVAVDQVTGYPVSGAQRVMRVVGVAVLPDFSRGTFSPTGLGTGAVVPANVLSVRSSPGSSTLCVTDTTCYNFFLLRYRPGTNPDQAAKAMTAALSRVGCPPGSCVVTVDQRPGDIRNYATVRNTPLVLGGVLALLAVGTLAHVLLTGVRRRRRDLAVLKTLGFIRSQVLGVVAWEASAFAAVALLVGLPFGVIAGRQAWALFATASGVSAQAAVPLPLVLLVIPVTLAIANLIAAAPGWEAARVRPATVLRSE